MREPGVKHGRHHRGGWKGKAEVNGEGALGGWVFFNVGEHMGVDQPCNDLQADKRSHRQDKEEGVDPSMQAIAATQQSAEREQQEDRDCQYGTFQGENDLGPGEHARLPFA